MNGGETPRGKSEAPVRNALYRNLGDGRFQDVAQRAGADHVSFYGMGVAVGDCDNDGFPDVFITGYPECALLHNNGNGTFTDITRSAGGGHIFNKETGKDDEKTQFQLTDSDHFKQHKNASVASLRKRSASHRNQ